MTTSRPRGLLWILIWSVGCTEDPTRLGVVVPALDRDAVSGNEVVVSIDEAGFASACERLGLPPPPSPEETDRAAFEMLHEAITQLAQGEAEHPYARVGAIYYAHSFRKKAIRCYEVAERRSPRDHRWPHLLARLLRDTGHRELALEKVNRAISLNPDYSPSVALAGDLYLEMGRLAEARRSFESYVDQRPDDAYGHYGLGQVSYRAEDFAAAVRHLEAALKRAPQAHPVSYLYGRTLKRLGRDAEAGPYLAATARATAFTGLKYEDPLFQAVHSQTRSPTLLRLDVQRHSAAGRWPEAARAAEALLARRPRDVGTLYNLAGIYRRLERYDESLRLLHRGLEENPSFVRLYCGLAEVYLARRESQAALDAAMQALAIEPGFARALALKGAAHLSRREWAPAQSALEDAIAADPEETEYYYYLGNALAGQKQVQPAIAAYEEVLRRNPGHERARKRRDLLRSRRQPQRH